MSAFPSDFLDDKILESILKNTAFTPPATLFLALYTTDPTPAGSGTEVTGGSYSRKSITFAASAGGTIASNAIASYTNMPAAVITHYGILSASTAGNLLIFGALPSPISANAGDDISIPSGGISISLSGS